MGAEDKGCRVGSPMTAAAKPNPAPNRAKRRTGDWEHIARRLEHEIVFGDRLPREHLVEDELMQVTGGSRHAVRRALDAVEALGLAVREANRGVRVRHYPAREIADLYEVRVTLETRAALLLPMPVAETVLAALDQAQVAHAQASAAADFGAMFATNDLFHETLYRACGNAVLAEAIRAFARKANPVRSVRFRDPRAREAAVTEHRAMIDAIRGNDRAGLAELCRVHILQPAQSYDSAMG